MLPLITLAKKLCERESEIDLIDALLGACAGRVSSFLWVVPLLYLFYVAP